ERLTLHEAPGMGLFGPRRDNPLQRSPWLLAAGVVFLLTVGGIALPSSLDPDGMKHPPVWLSVLLTLGVFAALTLAMIGVVERGRTPRQGRGTAPGGPAAAVNAEVSHRWGRKILGGAAALAGVCFVIIAAAMLSTTRRLDGSRVLEAIVMGFAVALGVMALG